MVGRIERWQGCIVEVGVLGHSSSSDGAVVLAKSILYHDISVLLFCVCRERAGSVMPSLCRY